MDAHPRQGIRSKEHPAFSPPVSGLAAADPVADPGPAVRADRGRRDLAPGPRPRDPGIDSPADSGDRFPAGPPHRSRKSGKLDVYISPIRRKQ